MADITKCANFQGCPESVTCYRVTASNSRRQSFARFFNPESDQKCEYYIRDSAVEID